MGRNVVTNCLEALSSTVRQAAALVRGFAFWTAVVLPMLYLPPLLLSHAIVLDTTVLGTLIAVNVAAIIVGHGHGRTNTEDIGRGR